jgi:HNH/ENDO VII superfamily nuclease
MAPLDAIAPPDIASGDGYRLPRITVRPKGVEPPPENAPPTFADASDRTGNAPSAPLGLFDDIVPLGAASSRVATPPGVLRITVRPKGVEPPPGSEDARQSPADASDETDNAPPARADLFDDIVPPESDGGQFAAPLPDGRNFRVVREGISPPAGFVDRLAEMWEKPPKDKSSLIGLIKSAYEGATLPGDVLSGETSIIGPDGHISDEVISRAADLAQTYPLSSAPGGIFGRVIKDRAANPLRTTEGVVRDEAVTPGPIAPAVPPALPRQIVETSEQRVSIPRSEPPPPARPPDKVATQPDRMTSEARESGPFDSGARRADAAAPKRAEAQATSAETHAPPTGRFYSVAFEMKLKLSSFRKPRPSHFQEANEALLMSIEGDPEFALAMERLGIKIQRTPTGLAPRKPPAGWTWHHADEPGVMQLVPRSQHEPGTIFQDVLHPHPKSGGGYSKWGK